MVNKLKRLIIKHRPHLAFLMDTRNKISYVDFLRSRMGFELGWRIYLIGLNRGLTFWWNSDSNVEVLISDQNLIDTCITGITRQGSIGCSRCHGNSNYHDQLQL